MIAPLHLQHASSCTSALTAPLMRLHHLPIQVPYSGFAMMSRTVLCVAVSRSIRTVVGLPPDAGGCCLAYAWPTVVLCAALLGWQRVKCISQPGPIMGQKALCTVTVLHIGSVMAQGLQY